MQSFFRQLSILSASLRIFEHSLFLSSSLFLSFNVFRFLLEGIKRNKASSSSSFPPPSLSCTRGRQLFSLPFSSCLQAATDSTVFSLKRQGNHSSGIQHVL